MAPKPSVFGEDYFCTCYRDYERQNPPRKMRFYRMLAEKGLPLRFRSLFNQPLRAPAREADDLVRALRRLSVLLGEAAACSGTAVHWAELGLRQRQALARRLHELAELAMAIRDSLTVPRE